MAEQDIATREKHQVQGTEQTRPGRYFQPEVDICEFEAELRLWADMPGVRDKDVAVTLKDSVLTIEGQVSTDIYQKLAPLYTEYNVGNYLRQFTLNESIDEGGISATMRNGVLELRLPKAEKAQLRRIEVKTA
jgi:HSP20 family protein